MHLSCLPILVSLAAGPAVIPDANAPDSYTQREYYVDLTRCYKQTLSGAYIETGSRNAVWDDAAIDLLDGHAIHLANEKTYSRFHLDRPDKERMQVMSSHVVESGCDDPLVLYVAASWLKDEAPQRVDVALEAAAAMAESEYATAHHMAAARQAWNLLRETERKQEAERARLAYLDAYVRFLVEPPNVVDDLTALRAFLPDDSVMEDLGVASMQEVVNRAEGAEIDDRWLFDMTAGMHHIDAAWEARGKGWANTVTDDGWRGFREHLSQARTHLRRAWKEHPELPESAHKMITVSMGSGTGDERTWFNRAVTAQFDYAPAYSAYRWSIRPRWGGSFDQLHAFGLECLKTGRFDTYVPWQFFAAMTDIADDEEGYMYWHKPGVYAQLQELCDGMIATEDGFNGDLWRARKVAIAWRLDRYEDGRTWAEDLGDDIASEAFTELGGEVGQAMSEIYAMSTPQTRLMVQSAREMIAQGDDASAVNLMKKALEALEADGYERAYIQEMYATRQWKMQDDGKQWMNLIVDGAGLGGWRPLKGTWTIDESGGIVGKSSEDGLYMACAYDLGERCEVRGKIELVDTPYNRINGGILFDIWPHKDHHHHRSVVFQAGKEPHIFFARDFRREKKEYLVGVPRAFDFRVQRWDGQVSVELDGERLAGPARLPGRDRDNSHALGIGGYYWYEGVTIRFQRLQGRRLTSMPEGFAPAAD